MSTLIYCTGFEHGLATPVTSGGGLFSAVNGTPAINATAKRSGDYGLEITTTSATEYVAINFPVSQTTAVARIYLKVHAWVDDDWNGIFFLGTNVGDSPCFNLNAAHKIGFGCAGQDPATFSVWDTALELDTWYCIDIKASIGTTTYYVDGQVNGNAVSQYSLAGRTASTFEAVYVGPLSAALTQSLYFDDLVLSVTAGDYPIGAGAVIGLRPNADGTHNNAANIMEDSAGNDIDGVTYFAFDKLDENPWITTANADYVRQTANGTGNYCEVQFEDTSETVILGVMAILQYASATALANEGACYILDSDAQKTVIWGDVEPSQADYSETTCFYKSAIIAAPSGGWTQAYVNSLKARFGHSGDANPDPYWLGLILEVAYGPAAPSTYISRVIIIS